MIVFRIKLWTLCMLVVASGASSFAQEDCDDAVSSKAKKTFEKAMAIKRKSERMAMVRKVLEMEPDYVAANYITGVEKIKTAKAMGGSYAGALKYFKKVIEECPEFSCDPYYYLGEMELGKHNWDNAISYYQQFLDYNSEDERGYPNDYDEKRITVKSNIEYAQFYSNSYKNPVPFDPVVVRRVSTENQEYLPLLTPDNEYMFFTRKTEDKTAQMDKPFASHDVHYIEQLVQARSHGDDFDEGSPLPEPFNMEENVNYGGATISLDNRHLYFTKCKEVFLAKTGRPYKNCDIFYSHYTYGFNYHSNKEEWYWTDPENLGPNINTEDGFESQPSLSGDGRSLYFASARADSKMIDIYKSDRMDNGEWGEAVRLPEPINTEFSDKSPFMHSDSKTLYFSSQGHTGFGGFDIYYTKHDKNWNWSEPVNIGYPINTEEDEHGFVISTDGSKVYYSSAKFDGKRTPLNILSFELYPEARPGKVMLLKGKLEDKNHKPIKEATIEIKNMKTKEVNRFTVDSVDGNYAAIVTLEDDDDDVIMNIKGKDMGFETRLVKHKEREIVKEINITTEPVHVGSSYTIDDINYLTNSADLDTSSTMILDEFADYLTEHETIKVAIHGHTDNVGKMQDNMSLSADRAFSVMAYLQGKGIHKDRMTFKGFGPTKPIASNATPEGRAKNRRTEFKVTDM